ncbi:MAG: hypothetical protein ACOYOV_13310 [Bacteroidales bacterium]
MKIIILTTLICICSIVVYAQPLPPINHGNPTNQTEGAPLDGGISILILLSLVYGGRKTHLIRKNNKTSLENTCSHKKM